MEDITIFYLYGFMYLARCIENFFYKKSTVDKNFSQMRGLDIPKLTRSISNINSTYLFFTIVDICWPFFGLFTVYSYLFMSLIIFTFFIPLLVLSGRYIPCRIGGIREFLIMRLTKVSDVCNFCRFLVVITILFQYLKNYLISIL